MGVPDVFTGVSSGGLTVKETDGNPTVANVNTINVSNGSLTDDGGGVVTISTGGGGGSGTVTSVAVSGGTTGLTTSGGPITTSGTITVAGTLVVANGGTGATTLTDNSVLTGTGTAAITAEGNLTFDGTTLTTTGFSCTGDTTIGNADTDKVGFYGSTIIVQPTTAIAGAAYVPTGAPGGPVDVNDTFAGYKLDQIVAALVNLGFLG